MADHTEALVELLRRTIEQKDEQIRELRETISGLQSTIAGLNETIEEFRRKCRRKEDAPESDETREVTVRAHTRERKPKSRREDLYASLPVREVRCPVPEDGRACPDCGAPMETIAWQYVREELRITPAKVERVHYLQEVLACPACRELSLIHI